MAIEDAADQVGVPPPAAPPAGAQPASWEDVITAVAKKYQIDPRVAIALGKTESSLRPNPPDAGKGATGMFQIMPATAKDYGRDPSVPIQNIEIGMQKFRTLLDANNNDVIEAARQYNAGRGKPTSVTDPYITAFLKNLGAPAPATAATGGGGGAKPSGRVVFDQAKYDAALKAFNEQEAERAKRPVVSAAGAQGIRASRPEEVFAQEHPFLAGFDPRSREGRKTLMGVAGGLVGGTLGTLALPGWGTVGGGAIGASLGGAAEQAFEEYLGTVPPSAGLTPGLRILEAGGQQGLYELLGQAAAYPLRWAGRRLVQGGVSKAAQQYFEAQRTDAMNALYKTLNDMRTYHGQAGVAADQAARAAAAKAAGAEQVAGDVARFATQTGADVARGRAAQVATQGAKDVAAAQAAGEAGVGRAQDITANALRVAQQGAQGGVRSAEEQAAADLAAAQAAGRTAQEQAAAPITDTLLATSPPSQAQAGRAVAEVFAGPGRAARNAAGQEVKAAAEAGGSADISSIYDEARRIAEEELAPPEQGFPRVGEPPPIPDNPHAFPPEVQTIEGAWKYARASAEEHGYTGTMAKLRDLFDAAVEKARGYVGDLAGAEAEGGGAKQLLEKIRDYGGIGPDKGYQGEIDRLWDSSSNRLKRGGAAASGSLGGVKGVLKAAAEGPWQKRTGGHSLDGMAELLRQDPQFSHITGPTELLAELQQARGAGATVTNVPGMLSALEKEGGVVPGTRWWEDVSFEPGQLEGLTEKMTDAQLQELVKHPAMTRVINRILNTGGRETPRAQVHAWASELQQSIQGSYDKVVKSQVTNITQKLAGLMKATLHEDPRYAAASKAYQSVVKLFTEGHGPLIKRVALDAPERIVQAMRMDQPTAASMLMKVLQDVSGSVGSAEEQAAGRAAGENAVKSVQSSWLYHNLLDGGIEGLDSRLAKLDRYPEFERAVFGDADARSVMENLRTVNAAIKRAGEAAITQEAAAKAAGKQGVQAATEAGQAGLAAAKELGAQRLAAAKAAGATGVEAAQQTAGQATQAARDVAAGQIRDVRRAGQVAQRGVVGQDKAAAEAARQAEEAARLQRTGDIRAQQERIRQQRTTPLPPTVKGGKVQDEAAFYTSTLAPGGQRDPARVGADVATTLLRFRSYYGMLPLARLVLKGATDRDLLTYVVHNKGATAWLVKNLVASHKPGAVLAQGARLAGRGSQNVLSDLAGTPPPPPQENRR